MNTSVLKQALNRHDPIFTSTVSNFRKSKQEIQTPFDHPPRIIKQRFSTITPLEKPKLKFATNQRKSTPSDYKRFKLRKNFLRDEAFNSISTVDQELRIKFLERPKRYKHCFKVVALQNDQMNKVERYLKSVYNTTSYLKPNKKLSVSFN